MERLQGRYTSKPDRLALMRVIAQLIPALSSVFKDGELEEIEERLSKLEEAMRRNT